MRPPLTAGSRAINNLLTGEGALPDCREVESPLPGNLMTVATITKTDNDPLVQISFVARFSTRKRMFQVARDHDVTLKALILSALRETYPSLGIEDADLIDVRGKR